MLSLTRSFVCVQQEYVPLEGTTSLYSLDVTTYTVWQDAAALCRGDGAHLAVIDSQEELDAIVAFRTSKGLDKFLSWVGFHDLFSEGEYITVLGKETLVLLMKTPITSTDDSFRIIQIQMENL